MELKSMFSHHSVQPQDGMMSLEQERMAKSNKV